MKLCVHQLWVIECKLRASLAYACQIMVQIISLSITYNWCQLTFKNIYEKNRFAFVHVAVIFSIRNWFSISIEWKNSHTRDFWNEFVNIIHLRSMQFCVIITVKMERSPVCPRLCDSAYVVECIQLNHTVYMKKNNRSQNEQVSYLFGGL